MGCFKSIKFKKGKISFKQIQCYLKNNFLMLLEDYHKLVSFIEAINHLANLNSGFDIVHLPHPLENVGFGKNTFMAYQMFMLFERGRLIHGLIMLLQLCIIVVLQR